MRVSPVVLGGAIAGGAMLLTTVLVGTFIVATSSSNATTPFTASVAHDVSITQVAGDAYEVSFSVPDSVASADEILIESSSSPDYVEGMTTALSHSLTGDRVDLGTLQLRPGDQHLWVSTAAGRFAVSITVPDVAPRVWVADGVATIEFAEASDSSWSSYVDPEGKAVYRSARPVFDESAVPVETDLAITETHYRIGDPDPSQPYYFLVFTGRNGDSRFVSSPIVTEASQLRLAVDLTTIEGVPSYVIEGAMATRATATTREMRLRVGTYVAGNPSSVFFADNSAATSDAGEFRFAIPGTAVASGYSDLALFLTEDGSTIEVSLDATGLDLDQRLSSGVAVYGFRRPEALQLTKVDLVYNSLRVTLRGSETEAARLVVTGTFTDEAASVGYSLVVKDVDGEQHETGNTSSGRSFSFSLALDQLQKSGTWYDVEFRDPRSGRTAPISTLSVSDMNQWAFTGARTYAFADFDGLLKVFFDRKPFTNSTVDLHLLSGQPSLVAQGRLVGISASDAVLLVRSAGRTIAEVPNSSSSDGGFRFALDLARLPQAGVWYDLVFERPSTGATFDFRMSEVVDASRTLTTPVRHYGFRDFNGQAKVAFDAVTAVTAQSATVTDEGGVPLLRVTGSVNGISDDAAFLRIRSSTDVIDVPNSATVSGQALFEYDLTDLPESGVWYDLLVGDTVSGASVDLDVSLADLSQSVDLGSATYGFREWGGLLKVTTEPAAPVIEVVSAELVEAAGAARLLVSGTVANTDNADVFLRIRTSGQAIDVPNSAVTPGEVLFDAPLAGLGTASVWYDLLVGTTSTGTVTDLPDTVADLSSLVLVDGREYSFHQWSSMLKVAFEVSVAVGTANGTGNVAALTFDDGPNGDDTSDLLDFLAETHIRAVFCVIGENIQAPGGAATLQRIVAEGHLLCNHTTSYADLGTWSPSQIEDELLANQQIIRDALGDPTYHVPYFRAPNGTWGSSQAVAVALGMQPLAAINAINDWYVTDPATLASNLRGAMHPGEIVIGHDGGGDRGPTVQAMRTVVQERLDEGWLFSLPSGAPSSTVTLTDAELLPVADVPTLRVTGTIAGGPDTDAVLTLDSGTGPSWRAYDTDPATGQLRFDLDLRELGSAGIWHGLTIAVPSAGTRIDLNSALAGPTATSLTSGGRTYQFQEWAGALKVSFDAAAGAPTITVTELGVIGGVPVLHLGGTTGTTAADDVELRVWTDGQTLTIPNTASVAGQLDFIVDLTQLAAAGPWYGIQLGIISSGTFTDVPVSTVTGVTDGTVDGVTYGLREWWGTVKITRVPGSLTITSAQLIDVGGSPTLRVDGTITGTTNADAALVVRTVGQSITVANSASAPGTARFDADLRDLGSSGVWYDLIVGLASTGATTSLPQTIADLSQWTAAEGHAYHFHEWEGSLKVSYQDVGTSVVISSAQFALSSGVPSLVLEGTTTGLSTTDVSLTIATAGETLTVVNSATAVGDALFVADLSTLGTPDAWYDLRISVASAGTSADIDHVVADLSSFLSVGGRSYTFHEWSGALKVAYEDVGMAINVSSAELVDVGGVPTLRVSGDVVGVQNSTTYLRVATGGASLAVPNTATTEGEAVFDFDLSQLVTAGAWHDIHVGIVGGPVVDVPVTVANPAPLPLGGRTYEFREWGGALKVTF